MSLPVLLHPSSGDISILGYTPFKRDYSFLRQIGFVMGQKNQLWWDIPPQETFLLHKAIYEIADIDYKRRLNFFSIPWISPKLFPHYQKIIPSVSG
jgi:ABC-2 type transport system ATP-binding protein